MYTSQTNYYKIESYSYSVVIRYFLYISILNTSQHYCKVFAIKTVCLSIVHCKYKQDCLA